MDQNPDTGFPVERPGLGKRLRMWFGASTFTPTWLPKRLQNPFWGYFIALLLLVVAFLFTIYLDHILRDFVFVGSLEVLAIALVALSWGVGPSLLVTFIGACLFYYTLMPPHFTWTINDPRDLYQLLLFILIGLIISIVASQTERAHRRAQHLAESLSREHARLDRSEREAANRALELEAIFESLADGLFVLNVHGEIIRSNAVFHEIAGLAKQNREHFFALTREERRLLLNMRDVQGQPLSYEDWPEERILRGEVLKGSAAMDVQIRNLAGRELWLSVSGSPLYNQEGELIAALCICRDVTERRALEKRTQDALNALLTMAEALVAQSDEGNQEESSRANALKEIALRMVKMTSRVLNCSKASIFLIDLATSALYPLAIEGIPPEIEERWWAYAEKLNLKVDDNPAPEVTARFQAGEVVVLDMRVEPFSLWKQDIYEVRTVLVAPMNVGGRLIGVLALSHTDPDYVYTQEDIALAGAVAQLLALVFERDRLLRERAEAQATELALRTANRRMEEFLGMVSHELKTPLTSIKGNTQLAIRQLRSSMQNFERILGLYEAAEQQSRRLNRLVDDLLDVSRTQAGHLELILGFCDLREIVREAIQEQQKMWPKRTIDLQIDAEIALPLKVDADRIAQVISNYLNNALKYSNPDQPVLVEVKREEQQVYVAVSDHGPGLPPEELEYIWNRFYRAPGIEVRSNSHSSQAGLGLGLYITRNLIEDQQGQVGVQSTLGEGSTFWFRLPLSQETNAWEEV